MREFEHVLCLLVTIMGVVAGSMKIGDRMVDVVLALQPRRAKPLHECSPEETNQVPVKTIFEHLETTARKKRNVRSGVLMSGQRILPKWVV